MSEQTFLVECEDGESASRFWDALCEAPDGKGITLTLDPDLYDPALVRELIEAAKERDMQWTPDSEISDRLREVIAKLEAKP